MEDIVTLAKELIAIPSTADNTHALHEVLSFVRNMLSDFYIIEFEDAGIPSLLVSNSPEQSRHFTVLLNAHLDVVPGRAEQFVSFEKNGRLYGRGAYDMKAAGAVFILLYSQVAKNVSYPLGLQLVTDEENGGYHGTRYQVNNGVSAEFVLAGENTNLRINNKAKGMLRVVLSANGKTAHGAYPWLGENAILKLNRAIDKILTAFPIPPMEAWQTTVNVAKVETDNTVFNKVPDNARCFLDFRYVPEESERIIADIKNAVPEDIQVEIVMHEPPQFTSGDNGFIALLKKNIESETKQNAEFYATHGASDVRFYEAKKTPAVCFGPVGAGHHADEEWVDIASLRQYYTILENFLMAIEKQNVS